MFLKDHHNANEKPSDEESRSISEITNSGIKSYKLHPKITFNSGWPLINTTLIHFHLPLALISVGLIPHSCCIT